MITSRIISSLLMPAILLAAPFATTSADELAEARKTYKHYCSKCHGENADGRGRMARMYLRLQVVGPTNFRIGYFNDRPDAYLRKMITEGGEVNERSRYMPPFKDELTPQQIEHLIKLIKLWAEELPDTAS